jgi:hypothetical protein
MNFPSIKTIKTRLEWLDKVGNPDTLAKQVRGIIDGTHNKFDTIPGYSEWYNKLYNPPSKLQATFQALELLLKSEAIFEENMVYINTGFTDTNTVVYDLTKHNYKICSIGDLTE